MIDVLIFSKDRAAQLDLLLRSIEVHAPLLYRDVTILWAASSPEFELGYLTAQNRGYRVGVSLGWMSEKRLGFEWSVCDWLYRPGASPVVSFLVDDDVFYRSPGPVGTLPWSFRGGDYDYPFSVDGVIYRRADIQQLLRHLSFGDPTQLEATGHNHRDRLPFVELNHGEPCLTGLPWNRVSGSSRMPHSGHHEFDLNERYLAGGRLAVPVFDVAQVPHSDHDPVWVPTEEVLPR